ncbi:MAG: DNA recombination protein RmuC [Thermodesulfobacteriota bacterium]
MIESYLTREYISVFGLGLLAGAVIIILINLIIRGRVKDIALELMSETETQKLQDLNTIISGIKESFGDLSYHALSRNTEEFLKLAKESLSRQTELGGKELENKKVLIDQTLTAIKEELTRVQSQVAGFEKDREQKYGELAAQLKFAAERTAELQGTTNKLREALASTKQRGQWGERMAEDILAFIGFKDGINYHKQRMLDSGPTRPDYTFILPQGLKVNMDVKFPLDNYLRFLEAEADGEKTAYKNQFLKDVRVRIKEVTCRDYINPEENTIDYVIVFIPNEQIYSFIQEHDGLVMDEALRTKVILCSPITLYAVLAVIRQAVDNFNLQRTTNDILSLYGAFNKQWESYVGSFDKLGKRIADVQSEYENLTTTRTNKVETALRRIEQLRSRESVPIADISDVAENNGDETGVAGDEKQELERR